MPTPTNRGEKKCIAIKYPPSGKEVYFDDGSWTNDIFEVGKYTEKDIMESPQPRGEGWEEELEKLGKQYYWDFDTPDNGIGTLKNIIRHAISQAVQEQREEDARIAEDFREPYEWGDSPDDYRIQGNNQACSEIASRIRGEKGK